VIGDHPDRDDLVAYSLGALDPRDASAVEAHAPSCARCSRELEAMAPAVAVLGESVEQLEPPPELRERVLSVVRQDTAADQATDAEVVEPRRPRRGLGGFMLRPAAALATLAIVVAAVGGYLVASNGGGGGGERTEPVVAERGIGGSLLVGDTSSMLDLHGLKGLTRGAVYQVWVAEGSSVRPSSNFVPDKSGRAMTAVDGHLTEGTKVMVTRESGPGHTTPTPPILLSATVD
jgi:hypothetical protein